MNSLKITKEICKGCSLCIVACPKGVIGISKKSNNAGFHYAETVKQEACNACTLCAVMCPDSCIIIEKN
ncbi:MAG: 4Fe-4S dicluster domain-containing protein [Firmicutes bacterium]|nr:4Fe-4S dicluster domain-containing protein [Bacillota bacterium]